MGYDTTLITFTRKTFDALRPEYEIFLKTGNREGLRQLSQQLPSGERAFTLAQIEAISPGSGKAEIQNIGCILFHGLCLPARFNFTGSALARYFYSRSTNLERMFSVGGLTGTDMSLFLGEGGVLLDSDIARQLWVEIGEVWPKPDQLEHPNDLADLSELAAVVKGVDALTFSNVAVGFY